MAIRFFFEYGNTVIQLPVNPQSFKINSNGNNRTEEVINLGEINILKTPKLSQCSFSCFFPTNPDAPYVLTSGQFQPPQFYIDFFEKIRKDKQPCRFIISDTKINMKVSIESFEYSLNGGDDDISYTIDLKEFRSYEITTHKLLASGYAAKKNTTTTQVIDLSTAKVTIGSFVTVNGKFTADSYGGGSSGIFKSYRGKVSHIVSDPTRIRPYHITTPEGNWRGWVMKNQITLLP